jgi:membrane fusion protein (multidrug efflux system)
LTITTPDATRPSSAFRLRAPGLKTWLRIIGVLLVVGAVAFLIVRIWNGAESTTDAFVTGHIHPVSPRVTGTVLEVRTDDNRHVHAGDILVVLDPEDFRVRVELAQAQIAQGEAQLAIAEAQAAQAHAAIASAGATAERTRLDLQRATELVGETPRGISRQEFDAAKAGFDAAHAAVDGAQAQLAAAAAARQAAAAQIATGRANLHDANLALGYTQIVAPIDGYVGRKSVEVGARINAGQTLLAVVSDDVWVVANYKETQLRDIGVGAAVAIAVDALPNVPLHGHVESFAPATGAQFALLPPDNATGNFTKVVQRVPVKIRIQPDELAKYRTQLAPGLSVITDIRPGEHVR